MQQDDKRNILSIVQRWFSQFTSYFIYKHAESRNRYPCKIVGEKQNSSEPYNTIILYKILGKRDIFQIPIKSLLDDRDLIEKFPPTDNVKIGTVAMGDVLFQEEDENVRKKKFAEIKRKMFNS